MIETIKQVAEANITGWLGLLLYWLPLALCAVGYTIRTWADYQDDVDQRAKIDTYYRPSLTVGWIIGRALMTIVPMANLLAAVFDVAPKMFGRFFRWIGRVFDQPLVPARPKPSKEPGASQPEGKTT